MDVQFQIMPSTAIFYKDAIFYKEPKEEFRALSQMGPEGLQQEDSKNMPF